MKIIFHGDDFGLTPGVNQGIVESFTHGLLRSASLVAAGDAFEHALDLYREHPALDVGVHLTLTDEKPLTALGGIFKDMETMPDRSALTRAIALCRLDFLEVKKELAAQIEKIMDAGAAPSHLDSHQFVHLLPGLFPICLELQKKYRIPFLRSLVREPFFPGAGVKRLAQWVMLCAWSALYVRPRIPKGPAWTPCTGFLWAGGRLTRERVLLAVARLSSFPALEIMVHPGAGDPLTAQKYAHWGYQWEKDRDLCRDAALARDLAAMGAEITSFRDMAP